MRKRRQVVLAAALLSLASCAPQAGDHRASSTAAAKSRFASMSLVDLQRTRATIFGRHGRIFEDLSLQRWLETQSWYHPDSTFTNDRLTRDERATLDSVREAEAALHERIQPGDMRFYRNRVITTWMLGRHSPQDWEVLQAEVLANHGYVFCDPNDSCDDEDSQDRALDHASLQKYFDDRYWYVPNSSYAASKLSAIEQQNIDTIALAEAKQYQRAVAPGMMKLFRATKLTDRMLAAVSIVDLRILRNEIYALHGRRFATPWLAQHFRAEPWYKPRTDYSDAELTDVDRANIALITAREQQLHESLGSDSLRVSDVMGLPPDDARRLRNEIYARHGRPFVDRKLRAYFASFPWYHADPSFRESSLNDTERFNADLISQYESGRFTEG